MLMKNILLHLTLSDLTKTFDLVNTYFFLFQDCFFLCSSETELQEHTFNKHVKKEIENPPVKPVCDICGHVCHSASNLSVGYLLKCG